MTKLGDEMKPEVKALRMVRDAAVRFAETRKLFSIKSMVCSGLAGLWRDSRKSAASGTLCTTMQPTANVRTAARSEPYCHHPAPAEQPRSPHFCWTHTGQTPAGAPGQQQAQA